MALTDLYIIRHADHDNKTGELIQFGEESCVNLAKTIRGLKYDTISILGADTSGKKVRVGQTVELISKILGVGYHLYSRFDGFDENSPFIEHLKQIINGNEGKNTGIVTIISLDDIIKIESTIKYSNSNAKTLYKLTELRDLDKQLIKINNLDGFSIRFEDGFPISAKFQDIWHNN